MKRTTLLISTVLGAAMLFPSFANGQASRSESSGGGTLAASGFWAKVPTFEELVAKLQELRERKRNDRAHGNRYQQGLAAEILKVKNALRRHHRQRGWDAAKNDPIDF